MQIGRDIRFQVKEATDDQGGYVVEVENIKKDAGAYHDTIVLKTDSKAKKEISIRVYGRLSDPSPQQDAQKGKTQQAQTQR